MNLPQFFGPKVSQPAQIITSGSAGRNAELGIPDADRARPQPADDPRGWSGRRPGLDHPEVLRVPQAQWLSAHPFP